MNESVLWPAKEVALPYDVLLRPAGQMAFLPLRDSSATVFIYFWAPLWGPWPSVLSNNFCLFHSLDSILSDSARCSISSTSEAVREVQHGVRMARRYATASGHRSQLRGPSQSTE
jgi:hypothetical protein